MYSRIVVGLFATISLIYALVGQHTDEILTDVLGRSPEEIEALKEKGAI
jgi:hypothetical protein